MPTSMLLAAYEINTFFSADRIGYMYYLEIYIICAPGADKVFNDGAAL
jgi:hypothetical protein